jgi:bifunctional UDP-N-acetylglucosamine pyrophosphorylase/glucosamine-1-phosphate N-acetyltransferase
MTLKDINKYVKTVIVPTQNENIFWGKSGEEILLQEFKDCLNEDKDCKYTAYISADCPLADKKLLLGMLGELSGYGCVCTEDKKIKIVESGAPYDDNQKTLSSQTLSAETGGGKVQILKILQQRIIEKHIENGVLIISPESCYIDFDVIIDSGATIYPNNLITGKTVIEKGCVIMPNNCINDSVLRENVVSYSSTYNGAEVGKNTTVGPNAYLRPNAKVGENCKIGDFVEIKNAVIGNNTKVSHLAYVGDAQVGENCNIGCGVIFANYDGKNKHKTYVGDNCFIGSNCNLIAPVKISDNVFVAAGTTVTTDIPQEAFCIGRVKAEIKENKAFKYIQHRQKPKSE